MKEDRAQREREEESVREEQDEAVDADERRDPNAAQEQPPETEAKEGEEPLRAPKGKKKQKKEEALKAQIEQLEAQLEEGQDRLLRLAAEFENHKRRTIRDFGNLIRNASEGIITQLVPIVDDFERALDHAKTTDDFDSLHQGVEMILNHLKEVLQKEGLEPIEAVGKPFDPNFHEALMQTEDDAYDSGVVVEETQRGYMLNDKVIRPAKVVVNK